MIYSPFSFEKTVYLLILFAQKILEDRRIAPLFIVGLGFGPTPKILVAVLMAFFPIVISGLAGLRLVDPGDPGADLHYGRQLVQRPS